MGLHVGVHPKYAQINGKETVEGEAHTTTRDLGKNLNLGSLGHVCLSSHTVATVLLYQVEIYPALQATIIA